MNRRVFIDAGHGGKDSGACYKKWMEKDFTLSIAWQVKSNLEMYDYLAFMSRVSDKYVTLERRWEMANALGVAVFVSIHCNADPDDDHDDDTVAKGEEIWVYPGSTKSRQLAECIQKYASNFANVNRGIKESSRLAVLRYTEMPAVLVEVGFVDDPEFVQFSNIEKIGESIADGIRDYFSQHTTTVGV